MDTALTESARIEAIKFADFDEGTNIKCTLCAHRVDQGLEPACVVTCPTDARIFGDWEEENGKLQRLVREARRLGFAAGIRNKTERLLS